MVKKCYIQKLFYMPKTIEVEKVYRDNYGAPGEKRKGKSKRTPEDIKRQNEWIAERNLRRTINLNFGEDDWHVILTYEKDNRPQNAKEARKHIKYFMDKVRKLFRKAGQTFKFVGAFGIGSRGAPHFHIIINNFVDNNTSASKILRDCWKYGRVKLMSLDDIGDYKELANYIIKQSKDTFREEGAVFKQRYTCSRNLIKPEPEIKELNRYWSKHTREITIDNELIEQGWYLDPDTIVDDINPITLRHYQYYTLRLDERLHNKWMKMQKMRDKNV